MKFRIPRPLFLSVMTVVLVIVWLGLRFGVPAYHQWCAVKKLRQYGEVDAIRRVGPEWLRRLVGEERMLVFDDVQSVRFNPGPSKATTVIILQVGPVVDDASLACIRQLPDLQCVDLAGTNVTDAGVVHLCGLHRLRTLRLDETAVSDASLQNVCSLQNLEILDLGWTSVSDAGIRLLKRLPRLKQLSLRKVRVTEEVVAELERALPELEVVQGPTFWDLGGRYTSDSHVAIVARFPGKNLKQLLLGRSRVTDACMEDLSGLFRLESLDLHETAVSDASIPFLKRLTKLKELSLRGTRVSEAGVEELERALPGLKVIR